jgi:hypothetical protein
MAWTKAKTAIIVGVAAILAVGTTPIVIHHYRNASNQDGRHFARTHELSSDEEAQYARYTGMTPEQAVKTLLEALSRGDWTEAAKFKPTFNEAAKERAVGLQVVSLGKPFWGWYDLGDQRVVKYGGVIVPFEIRLKNGEVTKGILRIRCDNPEKQWCSDSG